MTNSPSTVRKTKNQTIIENQINELYSSIEALNIEVENLEKRMNENMPIQQNNPEYEMLETGVNYEILEPMIFEFSKIRNVISPTRAHDNDAGVDFYIPKDAFSGKTDFDLKAGERILIPSGIKINIPKGYAMIFHNKSGVSSKLGLLVGADTVDENYQGEIHINLFNASNKITKLFVDQKIIQGIFFKMNYMKPVEVPLEKLYNNITDRADGGFGSTGA